VHNAAQAIKDQGKPTYIYHLSDHDDSGLDMSRDLEKKLHHYVGNDVELFFEHRGVWLASRRDAWAGSGIIDVSGESGRFVGQHLRFRTRFFALQEQLKLELGAAMLVRGRFPRTAPTSPDLGNPVYTYAEIEFRF